SNIKPSSISDLSASRCRCDLSAVPRVEIAEPRLHSLQKKVERGARVAAVVAVEVIRDEAIFLAGKRHHADLVEAAGAIARAKQITEIGRVRIAIEHAERGEGLQPQAALGAAQPLVERLLRHRGIDRRADDTVEFG